MSVQTWNCEAELDEDSEAEESSVCEEGKWNIGEKKLYMHSKHHGLQSLIDFRSLNETQIFAIIVDKILCLVAETVTAEVTN